MAVPDYTPAVRPAILVVDDYADALTVWELYLRAEGFDVLTASSGHQALAEVAAHHPDLVVLDLELPGKSGCDVARLLRQDPATRDLPLIAVTGHSHGPQYEQARQAGFDAIMVKPCDPAALVAEIRRRLPAAGPAR